MATQTKTVEVIGNATGNTSGYAAKRTGATGTATSVTVAEVAGTGAYTVSVNWDDASAANEPLGDWLISVGSAVGSVGRSAVTFTTDVDSYTVHGCGTNDDVTAIKAKTDLITSQTANQQRTPVNTFNIRRGDTFIGTHAVTTDYTGYTPSFTIRHRTTDAVIATGTVVVTSSTVLTVSMTATEAAFTLLVSEDEYGAHPYDIQLASGATRKTESGVAIVTQDVTRT